MKQERALVLGAGNSNFQRIVAIVATAPSAPKPGEKFQDNFLEVITVDMDPSCKPDVLWDLEILPWPLPSAHFDEIHAYEVLEHLGGMGDYKFFFSLWGEMWRVLKPHGVVCASTPWWESVWAWQDPGHKRVYSPELLQYLNQDEYKKQIGHTSMTDYRSVWEPPKSFVLRSAALTGEGAEEGKLNMKKAGFSFVVQKEEKG